MVVVPISADQPSSAERSVDLGLARAVGRGERTPDEIGRALRDVLSEPSYGANARAFQAEMTALPGRERLVDLLEGLAPSSGRRSRSRPLRP